MLGGQGHDPSGEAASHLAGVIVHDFEPVLVPPATAVGFGVTLFATDARTLRLVQLRQPDLGRGLLGATQERLHEVALIVLRPLGPHRQHMRLPITVLDGDLGVAVRPVGFDPAPL